ncbi:hypothetical protein [Streptomyces sp. NBC_01304]|uniref:hypothetical protein n=1 Tax=Streptomyces sp. NBC_01304 TaxID=2903818 RepID=UPI002E1261E8|nr:hypothetical protein OG430_19105 [Streptomyces sp. NBC_01304]
MGPEGFFVDTAEDFAEVAAELGLEGPENDGTMVLFPVVRYRTDRVRYDFGIDVRERHSVARVSLRTDSGALTMNLTDLAEALGVMDRTRKGRLKDSPGLNGPLVRLVHPLVTGEGAEELMRAAGAKEYTRFW